MQALSPIGAATRQASVLIIEDAPEFRQILESILTGEGYLVHTSEDGASGVDTAKTIDPDVIVLDLGLPGIDGIEVCRRLRTFTNAYVIMLTARDEEVDRLVGLAVGADDYMTKPFSPRELVARIQVLMRRPRMPQLVERDTEPHIRSFGALRIDTLAREVHVDDEELGLTKIEFDLLDTLSGRPNMAFSRQLLLESVWGPMWVGDDHVVDVHIANLRKKIDAQGVRYIKTVRGIGYRLDRQGG